MCCAWCVPPACKQLHAFHESPKETPVLDTYLLWGLWDEQRMIRSRNEKFAKLGLCVGDPKKLQCHRKTKPHHGMDVLSGCCRASPSLDIPCPESAGHLAWVAAHQSHISSDLHKGKEILWGKPQERFPSRLCLLLGILMEILSSGYGCGNKGRNLLQTTVASRKGGTSHLVPAWKLAEGLCRLFFIVGQHQQNTLSCMEMQFLWSLFQQTEAREFSACDLNLGVSSNTYVLN